ncbi:nucleotidyltransferase domain-containing protein [Ornithinibacillus salinisoli]|uniref:Nucleotidyltransferase domain-containing protein n=1 Tax=Ornithinibacillus salinisoli TaxID=1848459 RepID=A0ABW4VYE9_9BACI
MLETLSIIGEKVNKMNISWGVGGSLLLSFHKLIDKPNDIDILVDEKNVDPFNSILSQIGKTKEAIHSDPFKTVYFSKYSIDSVDIDLMGGFAIQHNEGMYKLSFNEESVVAHKTINGVEIPLCSLEDWYILYWLIPGKQEKAILIENYLMDVGVTYPRFLEAALKQPLPYEVKERVKKLLS